MENSHIDPWHSALLIVDVQNDYLHENGYYGMKGHDLGRKRAIIPVIERLIAQARKSDVPIVFVRKAVEAADFADCFGLLCNSGQGRMYMYRY